MDRKYKEKRWRRILGRVLQSDAAAVIVLYGVILFIVALITLIVTLIFGPDGCRITLGIIAYLLFLSHIIYYKLYDDGNLGCLFVILGVLVSVGLAKLAIDIYDFDFMIEWEQEIMAEELEKDAEEAWVAMGTEASREECRKFLRMYSNTSHYNEVLERYYSFVKDSGANALYSFGREFPRTKLGMEADSIARATYNRWYEETDRLNTTEGWKRYQKAVPSEFLRDSEEKIKYIEEQKWSTDWKAWRQARMLNTVEGYEKYLNMYPYGDYAGAAESRFVELKVASILNSSHGELPQMDYMGDSYGSFSDITIENDTRYTLTVLFSGPENERIVIEPGRTGNFRLLNGDYRVAAYVPSNSVRSYAGREKIEGQYSVSFCIRSSYY